MSLIWARAILAGWATLFGLAYIIDRPLLHWSAPLFGASWIATVQLAFDCLALAAAGWVAGRLNRSRAIPTAALFAVTLSFWNFGDVLALNVPWLLRLVWNSFQDSRFLDALLTRLEAHMLLFGCLMAGGALSRPLEKPISIVEASKKMSK